MWLLLYLVVRMLVWLFIGLAVASVVVMWLIFQGLVLIIAVAVGVVRGLRQPSSAPASQASISSRR